MYRKKERKLIVKNEPIKLGYRYVTDQIFYKAYFVKQQLEMWKGQEKHYFRVVLSVQRIVRN